MSKKGKIILGSIITSAIAVPAVTLTSTMVVKSYKESDGDQKVVIHSSKESLLKTIQGIELDDNQKVSAIPGAENKGEIAFNQAITKLAVLKQAALKENISVQELQKIEEKILQVIQDVEAANSQQQIANDIVRSATDKTTDTTGFKNAPTFAELPQNVKDYYKSKGIDATTTTLENRIFTYETFPDDFVLFNSITSIGKNAFSGATLPDGFTIPSSVTSIGKGAFFNATLPDSFTLPNSITSIGVDVFYATTLPDSFMLPDSIISIGDHAFYATTLPDGFTLPSSVTSIGYGAFAVATLPDSFALSTSITSIGNYAFNGVILPDGFTLPSSVTSIGESAFLNATLPVGFTIPNSITSIGSGVFQNAKLPDGTRIHTPQLNGNDLTLNSNGTWS